MNIGFSLDVKVLSPVVYSGTAGGGSDEYYAPPIEGNGGGATYVLDPKVPEGAEIITAWYAPFDNIVDLSAICTIGLGRTPDKRKVTLFVRSYPGKNQRIRIRIYVLWAGKLLEEDSISTPLVEESLMELKLLA